MTRNRLVILSLAVLSFGCASEDGAYRLAFLLQADSSWLLSISAAERVTENLSIPLRPTGTVIANKDESLDGPVSIHTLSEASFRGTRLVSRVLVNRPWYAPDRLIVRKFEESVPEYQAIDGLIQKIYVIAEDGRFGGVYFWRSVDAAAAFHDSKWQQRIADRYGAPADLMYWEVADPGSELGLSDR